MPRADKPSPRPIGRAGHVAQVVAVEASADALKLLIADAAKAAGPGRLRDWFRKFLLPEANDQGKPGRRKNGRNPK